jgi:hypothetical protein
VTESLCARSYPGLGTAAPSLCVAWWQVSAHALARVRAGPHAEWLEEEEGGGGGRDGVGGREAAHLHGSASRRHRRNREAEGVGAAAEGAADEHSAVSGCSLLEPWQGHVYVRCWPFSGAAVAGLSD